MIFLKLKSVETNDTLISVIKDDRTLDEFLNEISEITGMDYTIEYEEEISDDIDISDIESEYGCCVTAF